MIAYKVLEKLKNNHLRSAGEIPKEFKAKYLKHEINYPKLPHSLIMVFGEQRHALKFIKHQRDVDKNVELWEVETPNNLKPIQKLPALWNRLNGLGIKDALKFWDTGVINIPILDVYDGTFGASQIKLLKKVEI